MITIRKQKNAIKLSKPAGWWGSTWREALPTGNGTIGAAVYGGAGQEVVMITHADLWWQGYVGVLRDVADKLPQVRKAIDSNNFRDADEILSGALIKEGYRPQPSYPLPICDFFVKTRMERSAREYSRTLNMENGEIGVSFKDGTTKYERCCFVSRKEGIICYEITKTGSKAIDVELSFNLHERFNARTPTAISKLPDTVNIKYENFFMYFSANSDNGTSFGAVAKITFYGGSQTVTNRGISIKDADRVFITIKPFVESVREKEWAAIKAQLSAIKLPYDKLIKEHASLHSKLMGGADVDLDAADRDAFADILLEKAVMSGEMSPALLEKLWMFGRFLMVAGCLPNGKPLPPYALWCGDYKAINSQVTVGSILNQYSHALSSGLAEFYQGIFSYYEGVIEDLKKNSSRIYKCRGIFVPEITAHGTGFLGSTDSNVIHFVAAGGMVAKLFYDYYLYTDDAKFLKTRAMPFMRDAAQFYEEFLKVNADNLYESSPSYSPHTTPSNYSANGAETLGVARNSTIDFAVIRNLLGNLISGSAVTGLYKDEVAKWSDMLTRIPPYQFGDDGTVREYCDTKLADNFTSPSTAVFFPVYPANEAVALPELAKAFAITAKKRLPLSAENATAMQLVKYACVFARLGDAAAAYENICNVVRNMAMNNLVIAANDWRGMGVGCENIWAPFTTECNSLVTAAVSEMILYSASGALRILPALPDAFVKGTAELNAAQGINVQISWDKKKGVIELKLKAKRAVKTDVYFGDYIKKVKTASNEKVDYALGKISDVEIGTKPCVIELRM